MQYRNEHQNWSKWSGNVKLHVAVAYSNPFRWRTRRHLFEDFREHMAADPNVVLHVGELAYGDRPHEVTSPDNPLDIQLRTRSELFHKENLQNRIIQNFPCDWKYGACIDADFTFTRNRWAYEAIHQLQMYSFVQLFSSYIDITGQHLGKGHQPARVTPGFVFNYVSSGYKLPAGYSSGGVKSQAVKTKHKCDCKVTVQVKCPCGAKCECECTCHCYYDYQGSMAGGKRGVGATGGAWAFTREAFDTVGGMLEQCILGHGDWFQTWGLVGEMAPDLHLTAYTADYRNSIMAWQHKAAGLNKNISYIDCTAIHGFHGSKARRGYSSRDEILARNRFSPTTDLIKDWQGIYQLTREKPALRDAIREYFLSRSEDLTDMHVSETSLLERGKTS